MLGQEHGYRDFALSYQPANLVAKHVYSKLGFVETSEWEDDEIVARLSLTE
jgi:predicted GNAT family acetyltransferase